MATTPNLAVTHIETSQATKEVTANEAFDEFDGSITALLAKTVASANITLTAAEALYSAYVRLTGAQGANIDLIVPDNVKFYVVENACTGGFTVTVKTAAGTGIITVNGDSLLLYCDGTNVVQIVKGGPVTQLITKRIAKEVSASGDNQIIAAVVGKKLRIFAYEMQGHGTVDAKLTDGAAGTQLTPLWKWQAREGVTTPNNGTMQFEGTANTDLTLNLSGAVVVSIAVTYTEET